jgi:hypothetical protein
MHLLVITSLAFSFDDHNSYIYIYKVENGEGKIIEEKDKLNKIES